MSLSLAFPFVAICSRLHGVRRGQCEPPIGTILPHLLTQSNVLALPSRVYLSALETDLASVIVAVLKGLSHFSATER